jgi:phosphomannomutase
MTDLIISVSGVRGIVGSALTPDVVLRFAGAFGSWARERGGGRATVVVGRDARTSGPLLARAVTAGLLGSGTDVVDVGLVPTPTVQLEVERQEAQGGIVITASHNPIEWNALKFVGPDGIFLDTRDAGDVRRRAESGTIGWVGWDEVGSAREISDAIDHHVALAVAAVPDPTAIIDRRFHVALDCVRGAGGVIMPALLERLGCRVTAINTEPDGRFPRPPEPIPAHLGELGALVRDSGADVGFAVDPDVDRLAIVDESGQPIGEDYTLAFAVHAAFGRDAAPEGAREVVCNLSTSLVVEDAARAHRAAVVRTPVGEAHVARAAVTRGAVMAGEGNGGVIYPAAHAGRDAPVAAVLALEYLAREGSTVGELVAAHPRYVIVKAKAPRADAELGSIYQALTERFRDADRDTVDGLRLAWSDRWVHVRPSGTEPIVRIIAEAPRRADADALLEACRAEVVG